MHWLGISIVGLMLAAGCAESTQRRAEDRMDGAVSRDGATPTDSTTPGDDGGGTGRLDSSRPLADAAIPGLDSGLGRDAAPRLDSSILSDGGIIVLRDASFGLDGFRPMPFPDAAY